MGCGMDCVKYLLFIFNFIVTLCAIAIIAVGVAGLYNMEPPGLMPESNMKATAVSIIVLGVIIFVIAFFGCCGAIRESQWMTITFASLLLTILVIQVSVAIWALVQSKGITQAVIAEGIQDIFKKYPNDENARAIINDGQSWGKCCGVDSYRDYSSIGISKIPGTCCNKAVEETCATSEIFEQGCAKVTLDYLKKFGTIIGGVAIGIAGVEVFGIIFAFCLASSIKNKHRRGYEV